MQTTARTPVIETRTSDARLGVVAGAAAVSVRWARATDEGDLAAMLERCSHDTLYRRFHGSFGSIVRREIARMAHPTSGHRTWVAVSDRGVHGAVTLAANRLGELEVAIVVEDAWAGQGLGGRLLSEAMADAARQGVDTVMAVVQPDNRRAASFFRRAVPGTTAVFDAGELVMTLPVTVMPLTRRPAPVAANAAPAARPAPVLRAG